MLTFEQEFNVVWKDRLAHEKFHNIELILMVGYISKNIAYFVPDFNVVILKQV